MEIITTNTQTLSRRKKSLILSLEGIIEEQKMIESMWICLDGKVMSVDITKTMSKNQALTKTSILNN